MAQYTHPTPYAPVSDDEVRESLRVIKQQRTTRTAIALTAIAVALAVIMFSLYYAFSY